MVFILPLVLMATKIHSALQTSCWSSIGAASRLGFLILKLQPIGKVLKTLGLNTKTMASIHVTSVPVTVQLSLSVLFWMDTSTTSAMTLDYTLVRWT